MTTKREKDKAEAARHGLTLGEPVNVEVSPNLSTVVSVRLSNTDLEVIGSAAEAAGVKISSYLREAAIQKAKAAPTVSVEFVHERLGALHDDLLKAAGGGTGSGSPRGRRGKPGRVRINV